MMKDKFIETICLNFARPQLLDYHQQRFQFTRQYHFGCGPFIDLREEISPPDWALLTPTVKCRVTYGQTIEAIDYLPYEPAVHRRVLLKELPPDFNYAFKYADRTLFDEQRAAHPNYDDIIFTRNGFLTDASYSNLLFSNDLNATSITPETALLRGVKRAFLLDTAVTRLQTISREQLNDFRYIAFINALRPANLWYEFSAEGSAIILKKASISGTTTV